MVDTIHRPVPTRHALWREKATIPSWVLSSRTETQLAKPTPAFTRANAVLGLRYRSAMWQLQQQKKYLQSQHEAIKTMAIMQAPPVFTRPTNSVITVIDLTEEDSCPDQPSLAPSVEQPPLVIVLPLAALKEGDMDAPRVNKKKRKQKTPSTDDEDYVVSHFVAKRRAPGRCDTRHYRDPSRRFVELSRQPNGDAIEATFFNTPLDFTPDWLRILGDHVKYFCEFNPTSIAHKHCFRLNVEGKQYFRTGRGAVFFRFGARLYF